MKDTRIPGPLADGTLRLPATSDPMPPPRGPAREADEAGELVRRLREDERY